MKENILELLRYETAILSKVSKKLNKNFCSGTVILVSWNRYLVSRLFASLWESLWSLISIEIDLLRSDKL